MRPPALLAACAKSRESVPKLPSIATPTDSPDGDSTTAHELRSNCHMQSWARAPVRATVLLTMTAKERLRATVEELSEAEAADALDYIASRRHGGSDALGDLLAKAPLDDEPTTADEQDGLREARDQAARGDVVSAEEIRREFA